MTNVPLRHALQQGPVVLGLARAVLAGATHKPSAERPEPPPSPGPDLTAVVPPRPNRLIDDYIRHVGGRVSAYEGIVPFHLFPQWGFPILGRTLVGLPYDLTKAMNAGCSVQINHPLPRDTELRLKARLDHVDANDKRVIVTQRLVTECDEAPEALVVEQHTFIPLRRNKKEQEAKKEQPRVPPRVPTDAREIGRFRAHAKSGLEFAILTGDFNPLHWIATYARAAGFPNTILHGFSTLARSIELVNRNVLAGDVTRLEHVSVRFTRPLVLPADVGVYIDSTGGLSAGRAMGGPAYLTGTIGFKERKQ